MRTVMRVIAGTVRRMPLVAPKGKNTRPTGDRAKESLFSIIGTKIVGARFLDLYSGSGAIGIEALSRGAECVVFVEQAKPALDAIRKNLDAAKFTNQAEVLAMPVLRAVLQLNQMNRQFDIVFLDPPYEKGWIDETISGLDKASVVGEKGIIIAETEKNLPLPETDVWILEQKRDYGRTRFLFYRR
jgi:16S rRNA (guanine(966)-N(2))-methyltransferase RsmD